jgi:hypothetical protein
LKLPELVALAATVFGQVPPPEVLEDEELLELLDEELELLDEELELLEDEELLLEEEELLDEELLLTSLTVTLELPLL